MSLLWLLPLLWFVPALSCLLAYAQWRRGSREDAAMLARLRALPSLVIEPAPVVAQFERNAHRYALAAAEHVVALPMTPLQSAHARTASEGYAFRQDDRRERIDRMKADSSNPRIFLNDEEVAKFEARQATEKPL